MDHAVELAVFAPIGFALEAKRLLPSFIERGRQQVTMAKMVGQFAVSHGQTTAAKRVAKVQAQAEDLLAEFGFGAPASAPATEAATVPDAAEERRVRSSAAATELPISDYDSLAASQVIPRLAGLAPAELDAVEAYEVAHRGRKTILGKIVQLRGE